MQSVTLPDVYMCLPADVVAKFVTKDKNPKAEYDACTNTDHFKACKEENRDNCARQCEFEMIKGEKVRGTYDFYGEEGHSPFWTSQEGQPSCRPDGVCTKSARGVTTGATLQIRSGFGSETAARLEVPLYSMESFDLKTHKGVADPPVEELFVGGYGYNCADPDSCKDSIPNYNCPKYCPGYALASNTPWPLLFAHVPLSDCSSTGMTHLAPTST